jgi:predicted GH43/DUF377 family glycosyl hydrolase
MAVCHCSSDGARKVKFNVKSIDPVQLKGPKALLDKNLMSPFTWRANDEGELLMLVRAVPPDRNDDEESGRIWLGQGSEDGLTFQMGESALITPGPSPDDIQGCEDPTVVLGADKCTVYYTGVEKGGKGHLCYLEGDKVTSLEKRGVAPDSTKSEKNTKEATVLRTGHETWNLLFEYAHGGHSKIGLATGKAAGGPWTEEKDPFKARRGKWDRWHLSTGPMLRTDPERPVMFYNGADKDVNWGIGWVALSPDLAHEVERCDEPLIALPPTKADVKAIVFAASLVTAGDEIWLYYSKNDCELFRATVKQS